MTRAMHVSKKRIDERIPFTSERPARILVWGALGMIGSNLTETLVKAGCSVSVLCRSRRACTQPWWAAEVEWYELEGDETFERVLHRAIEPSSIIINLAGTSGAVASNARPLDSLDQNCRVQLQFLEACRQVGHKPHVVFASSRLVYGPTSKLPVDEHHALSPRSMYAAHKLCIEQYLQIYAAMDAVTYTACRISNAYGYDSLGASRGYKILNSFIERSLAGQSITLFGTGEQTRDFIYIDDLTALLLRCCLLPKAINQTINIGSGEPCRLVDAASLVRELTGGPPLCFQPWPPEFLAVESGDYVSDIGKMHGLLDYRPQYSVHAGIRSTLDSYLEAQTARNGDAKTPMAVA